jgi:hypothetical protein
MSFRADLLLLVGPILLLATGCTRDDTFDFDGDGVADDLDCAPSDPDVYPGAPDVGGDGIDQDCDGEDGEDHRSDRVLGRQCAGPGRAALTGSPARRSTRQPGWLRIPLA